MKGGEPANHAKVTDELVVESFEKEIYWVEVYDFGKITGHSRGVDVVCFELIEGEREKKKNNNY